MSANKSTEKVLRILELISKYPEGINLTDIYKQLKMPKTTVYDILQSLYREDAVYFKDQYLKTYVIGSKIFAIGQAYTKNSNFINFASPLLKKFAENYGVTAFACKRVGDKIVFTYKYESTKTKITTTDIGVQMPLHNNVAGKVFLAFASGVRQKELLESVLRDAYNNKKSVAYEKLLDDIVKIREQHYALDDGDTENYICSYAIPVFNFENKAVGVILASRIKNGEFEEDLKNEIAEFTEIAKHISAKQGYKGE